MRLTMRKAIQWLDGFGKEVRNMKIEPPRQNDIGKLKPEFRKRLKEILIKMVERGFDPMVFETIRTKRRQEYLFSIGRRGIKGEFKVTWTMNSAHISGYAADIISNKEGWSNKTFFKVLYEVARKEGCFTLQRDRCHVQMDPQKEIDFGKPVKK